MIIQLSKVVSPSGPISVIPHQEFSKSHEILSGAFIPNL
jgi:hypothetical protein